MADVFREVRERVSAHDVARHFGLSFDRRGWAICPFHRDRHPSMSFKGGRFRCWACGASGDSIDFTGRLLGLEPMAALERLNTDFALALPLHRKPSPAEAQAARRRMEIARAHKAFEAWRAGFINRLNAAYRAGHLALKECSEMDRPSERDALAIRWQAHFAYWADTLASGTPAEQAHIYRERRRVAQWIERVLRN